MRVGIDLRLIHFTRTGFYRYALGILESFRSSDGNESLVLLVHPEFEVPDTLADGFEYHALQTPLFSDHEGDGLDAELAGLNLDLLHLPFSLLPDIRQLPAIVTVHDLTCKRYPETMQQRYLPFYLDTLTRLENTAMVLTDSESVRREVIQLGIGPEHVRTCYPLTAFEQATYAQARQYEGGASPLSNGGSSMRPFLLSVGSLEPRKNYFAALEIFEVLCRKGVDIDWIVISNHGWSLQSFRDRVARSAWSSRIRLESDSSDQRLLDLYYSCSGLLYTSIYEGFGLPVLEAAACGTRVFSTPVPSLLELGFPADQFIDAQNPERAADQITAVLCDEMPPGQKCRKLMEACSALLKDRFRQAYRQALKQ